MPRKIAILMIMVAILLLAACAKRNTEYQPDEAVTLVKQIPVVGNPLDLSHDDSSIYVALDQGGIAVINRNNYNQKWFTNLFAEDGSMTTLGRIKKITALPQFNRLFINEITATDRITILDISDPDTLVYKFNIIGGTGGIRAMDSFPLDTPSDNFLMAVGYSSGDGFKYDRYDGNHYSENQFRILTPATASGFFLTTDKVYIACEQRGLLIYDRATLQLLGELAVPGEALKVKVEGNYAFIASRQAGLNVVDVSNPAAPVRVGGFDTTGYANSIDISGNLAAVSSGSGGVYIFDITHPRSFFLVQQLNTIGYTNNARFVGDKLVVAARDQGLLIYEIH
ncbi:MAG TPA: hypothetical protein PLN88_07830 [Candidatus Cloacimonadota bacterium]|nr:hypothetical protein [Candidatus Cloacimonadota bacterium]